MLYTATLTQKGQVTIPIELRKFLGLEPYEKVVIMKERNKVYIKQSQSFMSFKGKIKIMKKYSDRKVDLSVSSYIKNQYEEKEARS
jgi:AbrB family looped-hinge helix DNA binding protein